MTASSACALTGKASANKERSPRHVDCHMAGLIREDVYLPESERGLTERRVVRGGTVRTLTKGVTYGRSRHGYRTGPASPPAALGHRALRRSGPDPRQGTRH